MPTLSLTNSKGAKIVAVVRGGAKDGAFLYVNKEQSPITHITKESVMKYKDQIDGNEDQKNEVVKQLYDAVKRDLDPDELKMPPRHKSVYRCILEDIKPPSDIKLPNDSRFEIVPNTDKTARDCVYIAGMSGAGKSFFGRSYAENYQKLFPDRKVYLVSKLNEDETLDSMKKPPQRINLDSLVGEPLKLEEFTEPCLIIFDDFDTLEKPYDKVVRTLIEDILTMGRHFSISALIMSHNITDYKKTKIILSESHYIVLFPNAVSPMALRYVCENYAGMDKEDISKIKRLGRWVCIHKVYPPFVFGEREAFLLNQ